MKTYTEQDLRLAFQAGIDMGKHVQAGNYFDEPLDKVYMLFLMVKF